MLKKIGLSLAAVMALVALAKPPAAMAADRDDFRRGDNRAVVVVHDGDRDRDYRSYGNGDDFYVWDGYHHHYVVQRHVERGFRGDRDHDGDRR